MTSVVSIPDAVAIKIAGQCDRGKVREENQDTVRHISTSLGDLLVVADGIGGFSGGGIASLMAVDTVSSSVEGMPAFFPPDIAVEEAVCRANAAIAAAAAEPDFPHTHMGTTVVAALLRTESDRAQAPVQAIIGHVGDSRAYLLHNRKLTRLTRDHSVVQELIDNNELAAEEAEDHPDASILTRCLGHEPNIQVAMREVPLEVGDTLLLCSDGLWGYVAESEIERVLADPALDTDAASKALVDLALEAGGHDNVGIQLARISVPEVRSSARRPAIASAQKPETSLSAAVPAFKPEPRLKPSPRPVAAFESEPARKPAPVQLPPAKLPPALSVTFSPQPPSASIAPLSTAPLSATLLSGPAPAPKAASAPHELLRIFEPVPRPAHMADSLPIFDASPAANPAPESVSMSKPEAEPAPQVPAFRAAPPTVKPHVPVIELLSTLPNTARFADSMMLPELIVVPNMNPMSASPSSFASTPASARPQIGLGRLAAIFALAFAASSTLAYLALVNNWLHLAR
jgi:serine/threonine protein phosphatase PrpC